MDGQRKRQIEVFSAGCSLCEEAVKLVQQLVCQSCEVKIHDMKDENVVRLAKSLDIRSVPAVVITAGELAPCCSGRGPDEVVLRQAGVGQRVK